jgi:uncharacterized protein (TIGR00369 family)
MSELFEYGTQILKDQPFSTLLGAELVSLEQGQAKIALTIHQDLKQQHGFIHGGVISYLADNCLTYAGGSVLGNSLTLEFKINYIRPAVGEQLIAEASVLSSGKHFAVCECKVTALSNEGEKLVAVAQGTIHKVDA